METRPKTVAEVVLETLGGDPIEAVVIHSHPFHEVSYFRASAKKGDQSGDVEVLVPTDLLDRPISWDQAEPMMSYDEDFGRIFSFRVWSENWIIEHRWVAFSNANAGGRLIKFAKIPRKPTAQNPLKDHFPSYSSGKSYQYH